MAIDLTRLEGTIGGRVVRLRQRVVRALTEVVHDHLVRLHEAGRAPRRPERAEVEVLIAGIAELGLRYYSEGRRAELLELQPDPGPPADPRPHLTSEVKLPDSCRFSAADF